MVEIIAAGGDADARNIISRGKHDSRADRGSKGRRPRSRDHAYTSAECADPRITEPTLAPVANDRETARRIREHDSYPRRRGHLIPVRDEIVRTMGGHGSNIQEETPDAYGKGNVGL